jgi:hypothetical protein
MPRTLHPLVAPGAGQKPVAAGTLAAAGTITAAIAVLKTDLEMHARRAAEIKVLLGRLSAYASGGPSAPPVASLSPLIDAGVASAKRAKAAAKMRERRARLRAAAEAPVSKKSQRRRRR